MRVLVRPISTEVGGGTDAVFEASAKEILAAECWELKQMLEEVETYLPQFQELEQHGVEDASVTIVAGSNFNAPVGSMIDLLESQRKFITPIYLKKCASGP